MAIAQTDEEMLHHTIIRSAVKCENTRQATTFKHKKKSSFGLMLETWGFY